MTPRTSTGYAGRVVTVPGAAVTWAGPGTTTVDGAVAGAVATTRPGRISLMPTSRPLTINLVLGLNWMMRPSVTVMVFALGSIAATVPVIRSTLRGPGATGTADVSTTTVPGRTSLTITSRPLT